MIRKAGFRMDNNINNGSSTDSQEEKYSAEYTVYEEKADGGYAPPPPAAPFQNQAPRPKKIVTKQMARRRQLGAAAILLTLLILIFVGCAKGCSKDDSGDGKGKKNPTETTTAAMAEAPTQETVTEAATEAPTEAPTVKPDASNVKLTTREIFLDNIGDVGISIIQVYPNGSTEKNEVWKSSDERIATVDSKGYITAKAPGECFVILSFDNNPDIEIEIKVSVAEGVTQTSNAGEITAAPLGAAPAPAKYDIKGLHYINGVLVANKEYTLPPDFAPGLDPTAEAQFNALCEAAAAEGLSIYMGSNYRSYQEQEELFNNFINWYGYDYAENYAAHPGTSEHQSGLAIDCASWSGTFSETQEAVWLAEHAHEYGFIIRYPAGKEAITGYQYEAWHIRYVGSKVADDIYKSGLCLEEYLGLT